MRRFFVLPACRTILLVLVTGLSAGQALAQGPTAPQASDELAARMAQRDEEIKQLQAQVACLQQSQISATPVSYDASGAPIAAPAPAPQCAEVGSDMSAKVRFYNGAGVMIESPNKDFSMHVGGWMQWDNVAWRQNATQIANIGTINDGEYFRRLRLSLEGNFWETCEYRWNFSLENIQYSQVGLDECYVAMNNLPIVGTLRAGHIKDGLGFEGNMVSSSRCMTFMEQSAYSQTIELNQPYMSGLFLRNTAFDQRLYWSAMVGRPDNAYSGDFFGTGQWGAQFRLTGLPIYEDEGRHLLHLGIEGGWRDGINSANGPGTPNYVSMSGGSELRNDNGAGSPTVATPATGGGTAQYLPEAGTPKLLSSGNIYCNQEFILGTELLYIRGPLSIQAEYGWNFLNNAQILTSGTVGSATPFKVSGPIVDYVFNGGYFQVGYMLTGENRAYEKRAGSLYRYYLGNEGPYENAFLVRDEDGGFCSGHGAVELAARFSYVDLNAGYGTAKAGSFVNGGIENGTTVALNWFLNSNLTLMTDVVSDFRYDYSKAAGVVNGVGTELQISF